MEKIMGEKTNFAVLMASSAFNEVSNLEKYGHEIINFVKEHIGTDGLSTIGNIKNHNIIHFLRKMG